MEFSKYKKEILLKKIFSFLNENSYKDKGFLILSLNTEFKLSESKSIEVYYYWKSKFMNTTKCIPNKKYISNNKKVKLKPKFEIKDNIILGEYGEYKKLDNCISSGHQFFNNIEEVERYRNFRARSQLKSIDNKLDELIEVIELVGLG
ncbi:TPA: hypothetical protein I9Z90_002963 [Clostridium perfringens]|nr:hypothetical protein [Clostridium perfringens]